MGEIKIEEESTEVPLQVSFKPIPEDGDDSGQRFANFANNLMYSREVLCFYVIICLLTLFLVTFDLATRDGLERDVQEPVWFIVLDIFCVLCLVVEVGLRYFASKVTFWESAYNIADVLIIVISVISLCLYPVWVGGDFIAVCVLIVRYIAQMTRLYFLLKRTRNSRQARKVMKNDVVNFDSEGLNVHTMNLEARASQIWDENPFPSYQNEGLLGKSLEESSVLSDYQAEDSSMAII